MKNSILQSITELKSRQELRQPAISSIQSRAERDEHILAAHLLLPSFLLSDIVTTLCLGSGDTHNGMGLLISIQEHDLIQRHALRPFLLKTPVFQGECTLCESDNEIRIAQ